MALLGVQGDICLSEICSLLSVILMKDLMVGHDFEKDISFSYNLLHLTPGVPNPWNDSDDVASQAMKPWRRSHTALTFGELTKWLRVLLNLTTPT